MGRFSIGGFIVICLTVTLGYFLGVLTFLKDYEKNGCDMTYMYEYPQFVGIFVSPEVAYEKYALFAYSEGHLTKAVRNMYFDGHPVLFIPGNAGSYRQVRSFASVSLRKTLKMKHGVKFDFFTMDLNDELNGLNGALLNEQMTFVNLSISRIQQLYKKNGLTRKSIIIIAHSMGGIIAKGLLSSLPSSSTLLPVIITLATPHLRPPAALDFYMADFYKNIDKDLSNHKSTVISLSGGYNDFMVPPFYTTAKDGSFIHASTTSVPLVWLPIDHLCILWCKQLVLAVTRSIFALVDPNSHQINYNKTFHRSVFNHYLVEHNGIKIHKLPNYQNPINFSTVNDKWTEGQQRHYSVNLLQGTKQVEWHMIRLLKEPNYEILSVLAINLEVTDWIFACGATHFQDEQRICTTGMHLSHLSEIVPSIKNKRRQLNINMLDLKRMYPHITHIIMRVLPTRDPISLHVDIYEENERKIEVKLPQWWSVGRQTIFKQTKENLMHYELIFPQLYHVIQSYKLHVDPLSCTYSNHHAVASLKIPWGNQNVHRYITKTMRKPLDIRLFNSRPQGSNKTSPSVLLTLDPACTYSVSIQSSILGMLGNMARTYTPLLVANIAAVILLSFRNQLVNIDQTGSCSVFFTALKTGVKPYYILTMVKVSSRVLSWKGFANFLPISDWQLILEEGNDFFLLPLLLYMCSVGIVWLGSLGLATSMFICEASVNKMALKFLARSVSGRFSVSDWIIRCLHKIPVVVAIILIMLSFTACGGVALLFGCIFYFMKLTQMSQDYVEGIVIEYVKKLFRSSQNNRNRSITRDDEVNGRSLTESLESSDDQEGDKVVQPKKAENGESTRDIRQYSASSSDGLFFHFSLMLLWSLVAGIHLPHVLTWARNFRYSTELKPDPSFLPGLVLSLCAIPLWQLEIPRTNKSWYMVLSEILNLIAAVVLLYAPLSLYRLVYLLTGAIVLVTLHQILAPDCIDEEIHVEDNAQDDTNIESEIDKMKAKLE